MSVNIQKSAFSIAEFCEAVSIGRTRAYFEIKSGRLKVVKVGRRTIITAMEIQNWLVRASLEGRSE